MLTKSISVFGLNVVSLKTPKVFQMTVLIGLSSRPIIFGHTQKDVSHCTTGLHRRSAKITRFSQVHLRLAAYALQCTGCVRLPTQHSLVYRSIEFGSRRICSSQTTVLSVDQSPLWTRCLLLSFHNSFWKHCESIRIGSSLIDATRPFLRTKKAEGWDGSKAKDDFLSVFGWQRERRSQILCSRPKKAT